jgi:hypothetical protein
MRWNPILMAAAVTCLWCPGQGVAEETSGKQRQFDSPEDGLKALLKATEAKDKEALRGLFGPKSGKLGSGDEVQDAKDFENFARRLAKASRLVREEDGMAVLHLGVEDYPFPVPLVKKEGKWFFDTEAGLDELLNRRIGENEIHAARVCRGYTAAQMEYILADRDLDGVAEYAQRLASTEGKQDGLYWETDLDEEPSPLGEFVAQARAEGYTGRDDKSEAGPRPYHGYLYRIITKQGEHAPGGKFDYLINGNMVAGFGLVAYPVEWGSSGIMTFIINSNGRVLQKNLGEKTAELAVAMETYDPDDSWTEEQE